jgi:hypothetical protein
MSEPVQLVSRSIKVCWRVGCPAHATAKINGHFYCAAHAIPRALPSERPRPLPVTVEHVAHARSLMSAGGGLDSIATSLGVEPGALDIALWRHLGERLEGMI